ncbi:serine/threonine protein kinase [Dionaea muscipula]
MKPIRLPEPPSSPRGVPEIFEGGVYGVIRRAVIIGNGSPAAESQCIGLVRALGLSDSQFFFRVTRPRGGLNELLCWLPVSLHKRLYYIVWQILGYSQILFPSGGKRVVALPSANGSNVGLSSVLEADAKHIVNMAHKTFEKEGPLLVVASGWDTISTASTIRRLASDYVFLVQIQHPRKRLDRFDMVITPHHDYYPLTPQAQEQVPRFLRPWITPQEPPGRNVVLTVGALHQIDAASLRSAASAWQDDFALLPKPLLVVSIGGPTRHCRYGADLAKQLASYLQNALLSCGTLRISFSESTPEKVSSIIVKELAGHPKVYIWDGKEPNPHMGHLAWADAFVVTADSISMLSEACSTGKPVYVIGAERCTWKFLDFHNTLKERGLVRPFTASVDVTQSWSYPPLNDTAEAASRIRQALAERGWVLRR